MDSQSQPDKWRALLSATGSKYSATEIERLSAENPDLWFSVASKLVPFGELFNKSILEKRKESRRADVVILTALPKPEGWWLRDVFAEKKQWTEEVVEGVPFFVTRNPRECGELVIAVASQSRMGMVHAAILASKAIRAYQPQYVAMTGICAGVKGEIELGHILVADEVFDYGSGKLTEQALHPDYTPVSVHPTLGALLKEYSTNDEVLESISKEWTTTVGKPKTVLKAHVGPLASGAAVVANERVVKGIKAHKRKLLGVDMEAYGVAQASAQVSEGKTRFIVCKAVSDFADRKKSDDVQEYCSKVSALFLRHFLSHYRQTLFGS